jgi:hypothetical protein
MQILLLANKSAVALPLPQEAPVIKIVGAIDSYTL